ncbi:MAG TPA: N-acetylmuramoyl-L-alanine amidase [Thermomicrobiales bacterium]
MAYVWLTWLADALRAEGCKVVEESGWKNRGRPSSTGAFNPYGVLWHHTGTKASTSNPAPTLRTVINGRADLPGPLCQVLIDYNGVCHVVAAGRANHAGQCGGFPPFPAGDGNAQMIGFEIDYDGTQPMSDAQRDAATRASAACLKKWHRDDEYACRHQETSTTGKWDTGGVTGAQLRGWIHDYMQGGGEDWMAEPADVWAVEWGRSGQTAMNFIDTLDELAADKVWNRPLGKEGFDMEVALQRIYTWCNQMQADITAIKNQLG